MTVCHQEKNGRRDWAYDRIFDPSQAIDSDTVECRYKEWTYLACDCGPHVLIAATYRPITAGVCRCQDNQNGTTTVKAAIGVYLAPESKHNETRLLQDLDNPPTSHRAELEAGIQALITIMNIIVVKGVEGAKLRMVIIKSDSAYLLQGVTHWVLQWKRHGVLDKRGEVIENAIRFMVLEELRRALEEVFHVSVLFWQW
ncbi:conserved hypothetical protein [Talaromyces marneffei ATCC 18224]|uniref:RNase H type-1 domain-containing protein n=1 Tax=Talaromyces marneffei (strain ATCC 18224 / CBS 334.59 / QM 7333) TaxID=441960 RepID=B6QSK7_TALMQ|nr:conserved hypothetical protein [Talaromyces marneffei ATCC 18224]